MCVKWGVFFLRRQRIRLIGFCLQFIGEYDDYSGHSECGEGGPDRVKDDEGETHGGDSRGEEKGGRGEAGGEEGEVGMFVIFLIFYSFHFLLFSKYLPRYIP